MQDLEIQLVVCRMLGIVLVSLNPQVQSCSV